MLILYSLATGEGTVPDSESLKVMSIDTNSAAGEPDQHENTPKNDPGYSGSSISTVGCVHVTEEIRSDSESSCFMDPVIYSVDFVCVVKLQSEQRLTDDELSS